MGACLSTRSPARSAWADRFTATDQAASRAQTTSKTCNEGQNQKKKKQGGKLKNFFNRRATSGSGGERNLREGDLSSVPGRMFVNGASDVACLFTQQGRKGTNQDAMLVWENFTLRSDTIFCGIFDGHGPMGHLVAKKVRDSLPLQLSALWRSRYISPHQNDITYLGDELTNIDIDEIEKVPDRYLTLKDSFFEAFKLMDKELKLHPTIDCFCSGTTAVTLVKQGQDLIIGNVGDSRAILGRRDRHNNLLAVQLTIDLKPSLPREADRIKKCKGRVFALQDEPEVSRVWLPNNDSPGLAMARAFGDFCLKSYGVISVPDISYYHITEEDEFIVLATDGVWDVLSNKEVVDIVASAPTRATAARALVDCAVRGWRLKFPTSKIDDCAVVCLFLDDSPEKDSKKAPEKEPEETYHEATSKEGNGDQEASRLYHSHTLRDTDEIVPVFEEPVVEKVPERCQSTRSLADCISATEEEEWSALEGVTRVNSLLNLPRFLSSEKRSASWRKWSGKVTIV